MKKVSLDTSYLISFADPSRAHHSIALDYFRYCLAKRYPLHLSVIAAGEFEVGQAVTDLPLQNFRVQPFNLAHAIRAAAYFKALKEGVITADPVDRRKVITNDLKILAQAEEEGIQILMTEDANTLSRFADRLRAVGLCSVEVILLKDGFTPGRLDNPNQAELSLSSADEALDSSAEE